MTRQQKNDWRPTRLLFRHYLKIGGSMVLTGAYLLLLGGCDATIHQYPETEKSYKDFIVQLNCDRTPPLYYKEITYDENGNRTETTLEAETSLAYVPDDRMSLRFVVEIRDNMQADSEGSPTTVARRELVVDNDALPPQAELTFSLPAESNYTAVSWCDYVLADNPSDWHFDTSTLDFIAVDLAHEMDDLHHKNSGTGYSNFSLSNEGGINVTHFQTFSVDTETDRAEDEIVPVYMTRPAGRLRLYTNDLAEFIQGGQNIEDVQVVIVYKQFVSSAYNALKQTPCQWVSTRRTQTRPSVEVETGEVCLAYDYILTDSEDETHVIADFYFLDANGNELSHATDIDVPLRRNCETVIRGHFLTHDIGKGGLNVDESFDNEFVVVVP